MTKHGEEGWGNLCDVYKDRKLSTRVCVCVCVCVFGAASPDQRMA